MAKQPSSKQLGFLKGLGYRLTSPDSSREAALLIDWLKAGRSPQDAEQGLLTDRKGRRERAIEQQLNRLADIREMNKHAGGEEIVGFKFFRIEGEKPSPEDAIYVGAFLPLEIAEEYPELLLVDLEYSDISRSDRKPKKIVVAPGKVADRAPGQPIASKAAKKTSGCVVQLISILVLMAAFVFFVSITWWI